MKRFLLWVLGVAVGVALLLAAVMGVSYAFTTEGSKPEAAVLFGDAQLQPNGDCWQLPLLGGKLDKVFASPTTLTVQKLGTLYTAHPAVVLPDWAKYTTLTIRTGAGEVVFAGSAGEYGDFLFPANGEYKDVAHPISPEFRAALQDKILAEYNAGHVVEEPGEGED